MSAHTPVPWEFDAEMREITTPLRIKNAQAPIATIELLCDEPFESEQLANARLIAAAPALLAAARKAVCFMAHASIADEAYTETYATSDAAIKGATNEPNQ